MRSISIFLQLIVFSFFGSSVQALTITTLNLEWFGRGGEMHGTAADEFRQPAVKDLVAQHLQTTDIFVFQEVVDISILATSLPGWDCRTYRAEDLGHQHVVACAQAGIILKDEVIDDVRVSWGLRPAFRIDVKLGLQDLAIIGLHLKAGSDESKVRLEQLEKLLSAVEKAGPMIILGDFNSFSKIQTGLEEDDVVLMNRILEADNFKQVGGDKETYLGFGRQIFDRAWQRDVKILKNEVRGPCQAFGVEAPSIFTLESYYTRFISDHCPVSLDVESL